MLKAFAVDYEQHEQTLEGVAEKLRQGRDEAIRRAHRDGMTMRDIATVLRMTHQRVSQIVRN